MKVFIVSGSFVMLQSELIGFEPSSQTLERKNEIKLQLASPIKLYLILRFARQRFFSFLLSNIFNSTLSRAAFLC